MNKFKLFLILMVSIWLQTAEAKQPPAMTTGGAQLNIIFAVDTSGSMYDKYLQVQDALKKLVTNKSLAAQANFSLLTWSSSSCVWNGSVANCGSASQPIYSTRQVCSQVPQYGWYNKISYYYSNGRRYSTTTRVYGIISYKTVCTTSSVITGYRTSTQYVWVPLTTNKLQNYNDMMSGIQKIGASGGTSLGPPMAFIEQYLNSSSFTGTFNNCGTTLVIVLSDGAWSPGVGYDVARRLVAKSPAIKTFSIAFGTPSGSTFQALATAGGTGAALSSSVSSDVLAGKFMEAIQSVMLDTYTAVAPTIMPKTTSGDLILSPEFEYSATTQWKGYLTAKKINTDGSIGSKVWELGGDYLASVHPDNRKIWTAIPGIVAPHELNKVTPNNFVYSPDTIDVFVAAMDTDGVLSRNTPENDAINLLKFIRGYDVFDEDKNVNTPYRWKLNDIYNSKPLFVGQPLQTIPSDKDYVGGIQYFKNLNPIAYETYRTTPRTPMVYVGSNGGLLHAVEATTGKELWAFAPPVLMDKYKNIITSLPNSTMSIYGVDGGVVAQDVYIDGEWRTYLAIAMGAGAKGFSIIDVTNPNLPRHVVSIENYEDDAGNRVTRKWADDGTRVDVSGYEKLGFTTSAPVFTYTKNGSSYEPVLVIGAGNSNAGIGSNLGSAVYVVSLKPETVGDIVALKDVSSQQSSSSSAISISTTAASNSNTLDLMNTFSVDIGSGVAGTGIPANTVVESIDSGTKVTLSNNVSVASGAAITFTRRVLNEVATQVEILEGGATPYMKGKYGYRMLVPNSNGYIDSFDESGTTSSNITNSSTYREVMNSLTTFSNDRLINQPLSVTRDTSDPSDELNIIYGTGDMDILSLIGKTPDNIVVSIQDQEKNLFGNTVARGLSQFLNANSTSVPTCVSSAQQGWYVNINNARAWDTLGAAYSCTNGKLASKVESYGGISTIPIYVPPVLAGSNYCSSGDSAVLFKSTKCGYDMGQGIYLKNMTIGGVTAYKDNIYISVSAKKGTAKVDTGGKFTKTDNIITGKPGFTVSSSNGKVMIKSRTRVH
jgi:Neisseria PilC beta-propeller domain